MQWHSSTLRASGALRLTAVALLLAALATDAGAGGAWIRPSNHRLTAAGRLTAAIETGDVSAVRQATEPGRIAHLFVRGDGTQENIEGAIRAADGGYALPLPPTGGALLGVDLVPVTSRVPVEQLRERSAFAALSPAATGPRVRIVQSAKSIVRVGESSAPSAIVTSKTGQAVEIRALVDPSAGYIGDVPLRIYVNGDKCGKGSLRVTNATRGETTTLELRPDGFSHFRLDQPGVYHVEFESLQEGDSNAESEWVLYSATLSFESLGGAQ